MSKEKYYMLSFHRGLGTLHQKGEDLCVVVGGKEKEERIKDREGRGWKAIEKEITQEEYEAFMEKF